MTHLCVAISVDAADDIAPALGVAAQSVEQGATMVEWRVDALAEEAGALAQIRRLVKESPAPCIVTIRGAQEGGEYRGTESDRVSLLEALCTGGAEGHAVPAYIDFELADYERSANLRQKVKLCVAHPDQARADPMRPGPMGHDHSRQVGTRLILSAHDFSGRPAALSRQVAAMGAADACAVAKVAWRARSVRDCIEAFELLRERPKPMIALCMGEAGVMTRVLAPKFGAFLTFARAEGPADAEAAAARAMDAQAMSAPAKGADASVGSSPAVAGGGVARATAAGQPSVRELMRMYGFGSINPATRVYGVIGWPVAHSRSPQTHNAWFREAGMDAVYLPLPVPPEYEHFKASVGALLDFAPLHFRGASVTLPHKEYLVRFVREQGGTVDAAAERIGAANTLAVGAEGTLICTNTDAPAAVDALCSGMGIAHEQLRGKRIAVLGAGGVARAVAAGLADAGARVVVFNRNHDRAERMAQELAQARVQADARTGVIGVAGVTGVTRAEPGQVVAGRMDSLACGCFHAFVNCTPVGMEGGPDPSGSPLPDEVVLDDTVTVMDTVYAPRETPLIREARSRGARAVDGWAMFLKQAQRQFALWTK